MEHTHTTTTLPRPLSSLCWGQAGLMDWAGGNAVVDLQTGLANSRIGWGSLFDAAIESPSGRYAVIYQRLGTKALLIGNGKFLRELNRSYYCAEEYDYPIVFIPGPDGAELIAHCPDEYNRIELEDAETGRRIPVRGERKPSDFFHSRLQVSPGGRWFVSAGWIWHPVDWVEVWPLADAIANPAVLDSSGIRPEADTDLNDVAFIDDDRLLLASNADREAFDGKTEGMRPGTLGVFNPSTRTYESVAKVHEHIGQMLWLGNGRVVGFYKHPKIFDVATGEVLHRWPDINSGERCGCITGYLGKLPHIALDPIRKRFAVATDTRLDVVQFTP
ncbi:MAG: hypothetical protein QM783_20330 [Phycisphaerales bacterium]